MYDCARDEVRVVPKAVSEGRTSANDLFCLCEPVLPVVRP
jgi:hypothetical protein